jgi:cysteine desulfurase
VDRVYLDHNATTPTDPRVIEAMLPYMNEYWGNSSSLHLFGREALQGLEDSRVKIASYLNCRPDEIYFTSGGTESDNLAVKGVAYAQREKGRHVITSRIEHQAVLESCQFLEREGFDVTYLPVDNQGIVDLDELRSAIRKETTLVSIMYVNNEVGTIQPVDEIGRICEERGVCFHTDAVQAVGRLPVDLNSTPAALMSTSAHKIYGPKGVGVMFIRTGTHLQRWQSGGHHESGVRAGTVNVPGIVGYAKALEIAVSEMDEIQSRVGTLGESFRMRIQEAIPDAQFNGHPTKRVKGTVNFCFKGAEGEAMVLNLDMKGIGASSGSACTSGSTDPSHVLLAMGIPPEIAQSSVRFSFGRDNTPEHVDYAVMAVKEVVERLRSMSPFYAES